MPPGREWGAIRLRTNSARTPEVTVQVYIRTGGRIVAEPHTLDFGVVRRTPDGRVVPTMRSKKLTVTGPAGKFGIESIEFEGGEGFTASYELLEPRWVYRVTVHFDPERYRNAYVAEMRITTTDPDEPLLRVRLLARGD